MKEEKKNKIIMYINLGSAIIGVIVKVVKEILELIPTKKEN